MKFAKTWLLWVAFPSVLLAQDDFIQNEGNNAPPVDGLFDEEMEPLDEANIQKPGSPSDARNIEFPTPKKVSTPAKSIPNLPSEALPRSNEKLKMDFVNVEIKEVVTYFADRLQRRFIYDPSTLQGNITIISPKEVTLKEAWGAFLSALEVRGYIVFPAGPYLKLEKAANARKAAVPVLDGVTPNDDSYVTRIITLKYLQANDIQQAVRTLLSRTGGDLIVHSPTNTLIVSDYAYNIRRIIRILDILDVEGFQEQIEIIALRNASAQDIARKVTDFFPSASSAGAGSTAGRRRARGDSDGVIQKVVADERTNSVIVLGSERGIEQVKKFIKRIDVPTESGGGRIHVYPVQNVKAKEIAQTLSALASGASKDRRNNIMPPIPNFPGAPNVNTNEPDVANLGDVKITADEPTNSLVIQSSPRDFEVLKSIIRKLDIRRRQVFLEGAILEASVTKGSSFGVQATGPLARTNALGRTDSKGTFNESGFVGTLNGLGFDSLILGALKDPTALTGMALGFRSGGNYDVSYTDANGNATTMKLPLLSAILRLAAVNKDVNVLSTPHILATANEEASLVIGEEIPQFAGTETTTGGNVSRNITRLRVATELKIKPQINAGDYLTLNIEQRIDDRGEASTDGNISTTKREVKTTVIIKDQQTVVIGGLMRDQKRTTVSKVPFLGDIPILGWLFKTRTTETEKRNLLVFLTPYIIRNTGDMNDQFFRKLKERQGFLQDLGVSEKKGVPSSGLTDDQLKLLDPEYIKSLKRPDQTSQSKNQEVDGDSPSEAMQEVKPEEPPTLTPSPTSGNAVPKEESKEGSESKDSKIFVPRSESGSNPGMPVGVPEPVDGTPIPMMPDGGNPIMAPPPMPPLPGPINESPIIEDSPPEVNP